MILSLVVLASLGLLLDPVNSVQTVSVQTFTSGAAGLLVTGPANSITGNSLAQIGDYNGDGTDDFAVGSMLMTVNGVNRGGLTLIILGRTGAWPSIDLSTAVSGATTRRVYGSNANGQSGSSVGGAGDVNDDGFADVVIGAYGVPFNGINGGAVFVVYGLAGPYTDLIVSNTFTAGAAVGYAIYGAVSGGPLGQLTSNTRGVGDINNDGVDDFALSAYAIDYASRSDAGSVWVIFGSSAAPANFVINTLGSKGVQFGGAGNLNYCGYSIDGAGDFNNDGIPDLIMGANGYSPVVSAVTRTYAGAVYVMYGRAAFAGLDLATFTTGATGVLIFGAVSDDQIGIAVSGAGDVNGDGISDIVFGSQNAAYAGLTKAGRAYVIFGSGTMASVAIDLSAFSAGTRGFSVLGSAVNMNLGITVARAGDINQDGVDDFLVSSERTDQVFLVLGSGTVPTGDIDLANAPQVTAFTDTGNLGASVYGGQDVSGDGIPDIMMGSSNTNRGYLLQGPLGPPAPTSQPSSSPSTQPSAVPSVQPSSMPTSMPSISHAPTVQPSLQDRKGNDEVSDGGIAGIVIGGIVFLVLLCLAFLICTRSQPKEKSATAPPPTAQYELARVEEGKVAAVVHSDAGAKGIEV